jgi:hypothetical protein
VTRGDRIQQEPAGRRWPLVLLILALSVLISIWAIDRFLAPIFDPLMGQRATTGTEPVALQIGPDRLAIPAHYIRFSDQRRGGAMARVDLFAVLPGLEGFAPTLQPAFNDTSATSPLVFMTLAPRDEAPAPAARLAGVYQRHFVGDPIPGPDGLIGRRMADGSGYDGETIYFEPGAITPFVVRCFAAGPAEQPPTCLRDLLIGRGLVLTYRFRSVHLSQWRSLEAGLTALVKSWLQP